MKKIYLTFIVIVLSNLIIAQQKPSSDYTYKIMREKYMGQFLKNSKSIPKITSDSWVPVNLLSQMWIDTDWMNQAYTEFNYDSNSNLTSDLTKGWGENDWVNNSRTTYTYDGNKQSQAVTENWENEAWVPFMKSQWTYNSNGRVTNMLDQMWDNNVWVNTSQNTYTYDGNNCTELVKQDWLNGAWETTHRTTYEYDSEGNNIVSISETIIMGFSIKSKTINTFQNGLKITELNQSQVGTEWKDNSRATYSYNANRQETQYIGEQWTGTDWQYSMQGFYTYDANGNNTEILSQHWLEGAWVNFMKLTYNYQQATAVENNSISVNEFKLYNNYPNPFNPTTVISYQIPVSNYITLKIFDIIGNEIATLVSEVKQAGNHQAEFSAVNLPSGLYFYTLQAGNFSETKKMLMIK